MPFAFAMIMLTSVSMLGPRSGAGGPVERCCVAYSKWYVSAAVYSMLGMARVQGILP